jgi:hypothetical protein
MLYGAGLRSWSFRSPDCSFCSTSLSCPPTFTRFPARRRLRGRGSRCAGPIQAQQARRSEADAQASAKYAFAPERLVTDDLRSYAPAARELGIEHLHERGRWKNNRAENSHQREPTPGAQVATFQERRLSAKIPLSPRRRVLHFQRPTPSHVSPITPRATRRGDEHMARRAASRVLAERDRRNGGIWRDHGKAPQMDRDLQVTDTSRTRRASSNVLRAFLQ